MRKLMRAAILAVAVVFAVSAVPALAQNGKADEAQKAWTVIDVQQVPRLVREGLKRSFPAVKVTKAEVSGAGADTLYRLTITGKQKEAIFTAGGQLVSEKKK